MKKLTRSIPALALLLCMSVRLSAQADTLKLPYQKFPDNIPLQLLLLDSSTVLTADKLDPKKPFMVLLFSPECDHCKHATADIVANIDLFREVNIIMASPLPLADMKKFYADYKLERFSNITMGRDYRFMLPSYYGVKYLPFHAFYGKKKKLIGVSAEGQTAAQMAARLGK
ncbi:MAG: thioredoxin [Chitinophagaceae bacterium]|nr:MAG: thioredoxin [Chitinophagaceae bacterium]